MTAMEIVKDINARLDHIEAMLKEMRGEAQEREAQESAQEPVQAAEGPQASEAEMERFRSALEFKVKQAADYWDEWQYAKHNKGSVRLEAKKREASFVEFLDGEMMRFVSEWNERLGYDAMWREVQDAAFRVIRRTPRLNDAAWAVEAIVNRRIAA